MLTKQEITKKKSKSFASDDELPLIDDSVDQKLKHKRLFIILSIAATIGLSLVFVVYRQIKSFIDNPVVTLPRLPQLSVSQKVVAGPGITNLTSTISEVVSLSDTSWNITVANSKDVYNWPGNKTILDLQEITPQVKKIQSRQPSTLLTELLPQGLVVKEISDSSDKQQSLLAVINTPDSYLYIDIKYLGNSINFQNTLAKLIPSIYWSSISSNP
jgi:hypothetical protein